MRNLRVCRIVLIFISILFCVSMNLREAKAQTTLNIKVFLEGPYSNGQMNPELRMLGFLPNFQPYNTNPWNYNGSESVVSFPTEVVDWILTELLQPDFTPQDTSFTILAEQAALLNSNGQITATDGVSFIQFPIAYEPGFYVAVIHRNHIPVISSVPLTNTGGIYNYDFSTGASQAFGGSHLQKELQDGIWGMIAGDGNANGGVDNTDKTEVWQPQFGSSGYLSGDFTMNSLVELNDKTQKWQPNTGRGSNVSILSVPLPPDKNHIYIANDDHTDYFWTADDLTYKNYFLNELDYYLDQIDLTINNAAPYQCRFNCDNATYVYIYKKYRTATQFNRLISRIQDGHISMPFNMLVSTYGGQSTEAAIRGMYWPGKIERQYDLDIDLAVSMENQTQPLGIASLWKGCGAKYSWKGVCGCATPVYTYKLQNRDHEIYRYIGPDSTGVIMKWYSFGTLYGNKGLGGYAEARNPVNAITESTNKCSTTKYPYKVAGAFGHGWDDGQSLTSEFPDAAQNNTNSTRQCYVSNETDFFQDFLSSYPSSSLPSESVSYGNDWDTDCASMAEPTAQVKRSVEKLRSAEAMATLVASKNPSFYPSDDPNRDAAWVALGSYWEHNFGLGGCCTTNRGNWELNLLDDIQSYVDGLYTASHDLLSTQIQYAGTNQRFFAFNPLGWARNDYADYEYNGSNNIRIVDVQSASEVPHQIITRNGITYLRIYAVDLPTVGYRVYEIQDQQSGIEPNTATLTNTIFESNRYILNITPAGAIISLIDKLNGNQEYVQSINSRYVNDFGQGTSSTGTLTLLDNGPVSATVQCISSVPLQHTTLITLYRDIDRIDIENTINATFGNTIRTYSFSFNLPNPTTHHEELGAILTAKYKNNGGNYALPAKPVRFEWQTLNHFVDVSSANYGISISNDGAAFMKLGSSSLQFLDQNSSQINVLIGGRMAGTGPGFDNQFGNTVFHNNFSLLPYYSGYSPLNDMRHAMEHQNRIITGIVTGTNNTFPADYYSFLTISDPNGILWVLKPSEEGTIGGIIARIWNIAPVSSACILDFTDNLTSAKRTTHVETDIEDMPVSSGNLSVTIGQQNMQTFRVFLSGVSLSAVLKK